MTLENPFEWVNKEKSDLEQINDVPLLGSAPPFPWKSLADKLAGVFKIEKLEITPSVPALRSADRLYEGLGEAPFSLFFALPSMKGTCCWVMPEQEMAILESLCVSKEPHPLTFQNRLLSESFYRFLALEVLYQIVQLKYDKALTPVMLKQKPSFTSAAVCLDISLEINHSTLMGRLIISNELRQSWIAHFAEKVSTTTQSLLKKLPITLSVTLGKLNFTQDEWLQLNLGDWIPIKDMGYSIEDERGPVIIQHDGKGIFSGELEKGKITITEKMTHQDVSS